MCFVIFYGVASDLTYHLSAAGVVGQANLPLSNEAGSMLLQSGDVGFVVFNAIITSYWTVDAVLYQPSFL